MFISNILYTPKYYEIIFNLKMDTQYINPKDYYKAYVTGPLYVGGRYVP